MASLADIIFYLVLFASSAGLIYVGEKHRSKTLTALGLLAPVVYAAVRLNVGVDYVNYTNIANDLSEITLPEFLNSGYAIIYEHSVYYITQLARLFPVWQIIFFGVYSLITILPFYFAMRKVNPKYTWLAILFYLLMFFAPSLNGMRQFAAISIIFYATISYIYSNRVNLAKVCYFLALILAATFLHSSAICGVMVLPIVWLAKALAKKPAGRIIFYSLLAMGAVILLELFVVQNIEHIPFLNRYAHYLTWEKDGAPMPNLIPRLFPLFVGGWMLLKRELKNERVVIYYALTAVALVLTFLGFLVPYGYRMSDYFLVFQIPLFIEAVTHAKTTTGQQKFYLKIFIAYAIVYFLYSSALNNSHLLFPYQFIFWPW